MYARSHTGALMGVEALPVTVESSRTRGLPGDTVIGLARGAAAEAMMRVQSAVRALGIEIPKARHLVNLLPAELPKEMSSVDLALAVALLGAAGVIPPERLAGRRFFGELALSGKLEPVRGAVLMADLVRQQGEQELIVSAANAAEAAIIPGVRVIPVATLAEAVVHLNGDPITQALPLTAALPATRRCCLSDVVGQTRAKRALEIAAAGGHNLLMVGPPGSGKTMLARRLASLLPELNADEQIEVTRIHSAAGLLTSTQGLMHERPFRAPHHTASDVALCGGGGRPRPGEITLAHRGVLFLDELPEFSRRALEALREPIESGLIHVARAAQSVVFPADVMLVAAMNPCPCGHYRGQQSGTRQAPCLCSLDQISRYRARVSGPLLDRFDLHLWIDPTPLDTPSLQAAETSTVVRARVAAARQRQAERLGTGRLNADMSEEEVRRSLEADPVARAHLRAAAPASTLSTRGATRVVKVAQSIADLAGRTHPNEIDLREALRLRIDDSQDRPWGQAAA